MTIDRDRASARTRPRWRRAGRVVLIGLAVLVLVAVLLVALRPPREAVLIRVVRTLRTELPGQLSIVRAAWPSPFRLELEGIRWEYREQLLLALDEVHFELNARALLRRELHVYRLRVRGSHVDLPAIQTGLAERSSKPAPPDAARDPGGSGGFPREGALPGIPSIRIDQLSVELDSLLIAPGRRVADLAVAGSIDLSRGGDARAGFAINATDPGQVWELRRAELDLGFAEGRLGGVIEFSTVSTGPVELKLEPTAPERFDLRLRVLALDEARDGSLVRLHGQLHRDGRRPVGLDLEGRLALPSAEALAALPWLHARATGLAPIESLEFALDTRAHWGSDDGPDIRVSMSAAPHPWVRAAQLELKHQAGRSTLERLQITLPSLRLRADGSLAGGDCAAHVDVESEGLAWLEPWVDAIPSLDSLQLRARAELTGPLAAPAWTLRANSFVQIGSTTLDSLRLEANGARGLDAPVSLELRAGAVDHTLALRAEAGLGEELQLRLAPLWVHRGRAAPRIAAASLPAESNVFFDEDSGSVRVAPLRIRGDYGEGELRASLELGAEGKVDLEWSLREPPRALLNALDARGDSWTLLWPSDEKLGFSLAASLDLSASPPAFSGRLDATLPGPASFPKLLPAGAQVDDLGIVRLQAKAWRGVRIGSSRSDSTTIELDLGATAWIDSAWVRTQVAPAGDLRVRAGGGLPDAFTWRVDGSLAQGRWLADATLQLRDPSLLERLAIVSPAPRRLEGTATIHFEGSTSTPDLSAELSGAFEDAELVVPAAELAFRWTHAGLHGRAQLPAGMSSAHVVLDRVDLEASSAGGELASLTALDYAIDARGPRIALSHAGELAWGDSLQLRGRRLRLELDGRELESQQEFAIAAVSGRVSVHDFDLAGSMGHIRVNGSAQAGALDLDAEVELALGERPPELRMPDSLWPRSLELNLEASGDTSVRGNARLAGVRLDGRREAEIRLSLESRETWLDAELLILDADQTLAEGRGHLPIDLNRAGVTLREDSLQLHLRLLQFPIPALWLAGSEEAGRTILSAGELILDGRSDAPRLQSQIEFTFPGWERLGIYRIDAGFELTAAPDRRLDSRWTVTRDAARLLTAEGGVPLELSLIPFKFVLADSAQLRADLRSELLRLRDFSELLPANLAVEGECRLNAHAEGALRDPELEAELEFDSVRAVLVDGSRVGGRGRLSVTGRMEAPRVTGAIQVDSGVLLVPDSPPNLHPVQGSSLLWEKANADADSVGLGERRAESGGPARTPAAAALDVDIDLTVPSGLWIRGKGLDVEMSGDLRLGYRGTAVVSGKLQAVRGNLVFLGRDFELQRGEVEFFGQTEPDPSFDIVLQSTVAEVVVTIHMGGSSKKPTLSLTSDPEMTEGDISSLLLFGRKLEELDDDQLGLVQSRTNDVARAYGIARLESELRQQLRVDLLRFKSGEADGSSSILVGKYLSSRILLRYEQMLQDQTAFLVNLEYLLSRHLKLETIYGRQQQSGAELNWGTDY